MGGRVGLDQMILARVVVLRGAGKTQAEIGKHLGISQQTVSRYVAHARTHDPQTIVEWAAYWYNVPQLPKVGGNVIG